MQHHDGVQQRAFPLPVSPPTNDVHRYILFYKLLWMDIARVASVPALTVWSIDHGLCVRSDHADRIRKALQRLTGVAFTGPIPVFTDTPR
jgi:hypothetical protein